MEKDKSKQNIDEGFTCLNCTNMRYRLKNGAGGRMLFYLENGKLIPHKPKGSAQYLFFCAKEQWKLYNKYGERRNYFASGVWLDSFDSLRKNKDMLKYCFLRCKHKDLE